MNLLDAVKFHIEDVSIQVGAELFSIAQKIFNNNDCQLLTQSPEKFEFLLSDEFPENEIAILIDTDDDDNLLMASSRGKWTQFSLACLLQMEHELSLLDPKEKLDHKKYSREGMIKRVLAERRQKALSANYQIKWANNIYGDHIVTNERGVKYKVFLRDFKNETGYSDSKDAEINKLGTTKHIMHVYHKLKEDKQLYARLHKTCPFVEVYCDPLNDYRISYFYPEKVKGDTKFFLQKYFKGKNYIEDKDIFELSDFLTEAQFFDNIVVRPEVKEKVEWAWEKRYLDNIREKIKPEHTQIKAKLYNYQEEGIEFATFKKYSIIADEMGLGKTLQAIGAAIQKKNIFGFKKTLIVCPASLKAQWKKEIEKFTDEKALLVEGHPEEREAIYKSSGAYFYIVNYETILRDQVAVSKANFDFLILDEAQKVKNYATKTAGAVKNINRKHVLVITGTPIENKLIDLFSIMAILDPQFLGPLWEFSYQHCLFDNEKHNKINGYYNLSQLNEKLKPVLLRREKRKVLEQLPNVQQHDIPVAITPLQEDYHASFARGLAQITSKKFLTAYDMQRIQQLLTSMRMVCNSTYLVDEETNESPKLEELKYILLEKLDLQNQDRKVIIFSEWVKTHKLIGQMLRQSNIGFAELNGRVPVAKRGELIHRFENDKACKVFLSTETGGAGLNLQVADILINFELPWNPAKKNQRIGRIDRLGQQSGNLTIFNLITERSIERRISLGLLVKQNLFDSVLNEGNQADFVDFSEKGRSQFLQQMQEMADEFSSQESNEDIYEEEAVQNESLVNASEQEQEETAEDNIVEEHSVGENGSSDAEEYSGTESESQPEQSASNAVNAEKMEQVMNNGMQFLSGLLQMATGKNIGIDEQKIEINKETGEVTMKFKLPLDS